MIVELAGGTIEGELFEIKQELPEPLKFMLTFDQINSTIGQNISKDDVSNILTGLEIKIEHSNDEGMLIEIPRYRVDVTVLQMSSKKYLGYTATIMLAFPMY